MNGVNLAGLFSLFLYVLFMYCLLWIFPRWMKRKLSGKSPPQEARERFSPSQSIRRRTIASVSVLRKVLPSAVGNEGADNAQAKAIRRDLIDTISTALRRHLPSGFNWFDLLLIVLLAWIMLLGLLAYINPDGVAFSSFAVIPYLILSPAPTMAVYAAVFGVTWFTISRVHRIAGLIAGLLMMLGVGVGLPTWINTRIEQEVHRSTVPDVTPPEPIKLSPIFAIEEPFDSYGSEPESSNSCRALCQAILYSGSAQAVIMAKPAESERVASIPMIWKLEQRDQPCRVITRSHESFARWPAPLNLQDRVEARSLTGECLVGAPTGRSQAQLILRYQDFRTEALQAKPGTALAPSRGKQIVLLDRSRILARRTILAPRKLAVPLRLDLAGSPNSGAYWKWGTEPDYAPPRPFDLSDWLLLNTGSLEGPNPDRLRRAVDVWLAGSQPGNDADADAIAHNLQERYFDMIEQFGEADRDMPRVKAMLRDERTDRVDDLGKVLRRFPGHVPELRDIIIDRIAAFPPEDARTNEFSQSLGTFPSTAFTKLHPGLVRLVEDPTRRPELDTAILRLTDAGPASAPILFGIIDDSLSRQTEQHELSALFAIQALCRIGPAIAPSYTRLEQIVGAHPNAAARIADRWLWAVTRVRLGRAPETISNAVPSNSDMPNWKANLRDDVAKGVCEIS